MQMFQNHLDFLAQYSYPEILDNSMEDYRLLIICLKDCSEEIIPNQQDFPQFQTELIDQENFLQ